MARVVPELEREDRYLKFRHRDRDAAEALRDELQAMGDSAVQVVARLGAQATEADWAEQVGTLREETALWPLLAARVDEALFGHDPQLGRWLQRRLATAWQEEWERVLGSTDEVGHAAHEALRERLWRQALGSSLAAIQAETRPTREKVEALLSRVEDALAARDTGGDVANPLQDALWAALQQALTEQLTRIERNTEALLEGQGEIRHTLDRLPRLSSLGNGPPHAVSSDERLGTP